MDWISVEERLPEEGEVVVAWLFQIEEPTCCTFLRDDIGPLWNMLYVPDDPYRHRYLVSHWLPLPKKPKQVN